MEMENHPIKAIMDLSHLVRRATEQQMADLEISSVQSRVLGYLWWKAWKKEPGSRVKDPPVIRVQRGAVSGEAGTAGAQMRKYRCQTKGAGTDR